MMKKFLILFLIGTLLLGASCGDDPKINDVAGSPPVHAATGSPHISATPLKAPDKSVEVLSTAAHIFEGASGPTLYGAIEYRNIGEKPLYITSASFSFSVDGKSVFQEFVPPLNKFDIIMPGERSFLTLWHMEPDLKLNAQATLTAYLKYEASEENRIPLQVSNLYLAGNYPKFTTLSGTVENTNGFECPMNMIYVGFYDEKGALLGVWHFSHNALLEAGDIKSFVVHMKELPIQNLASRCASFHATAFGFE